MKSIKQMLLGITVMIASIAFHSVWDNDTVTVIVAFIGLVIVIYGYLHKDGDKKDV